MRNSILITSFILLFSATNYAQEDLKFGVKGGVSTTNLTSDYFSQTNNTMGLYVGFFSEIPLSRRLFIQPEVLYANQGAEIEAILDGGTASGEYVLDYLQVPVLAKFRFFQNLSLEAGSSFNFLLNQEYKAGINSRSDFAKSFEFGGVVGVSYGMHNGLFGSARYYQGFTDAFNQNSGPKDVTNSGFQIGVGYGF